MLKGLCLFRRNSGVLAECLVCANEPAHVVRIIFQIIGIFFASKDDTHVIVARVFEFYPHGKLLIVGGTLGLIVNDARDLVVNFAARFVSGVA